MITSKHIATMLALMIGACILSAQTSSQKRPAAPAKAAPAAKPVTVAKDCPIPHDENRPIMRLIMTDGSYQPVSKCELLDGGQRVHYKSAERGEWEDVPTSMVDWAASEKYAKEGPPEQVKEAEEAKALDAEEEAERKKEESKSPEVSHRLRLPEQGGVFVLDYWRDEPQLIELVQNGSDINKNMGRNILRAAINPIAKSKQTIELKGTHARVQAHVPQPTLYVSIDSDEQAAAQDVSQHFRIVKAEQKKELRVVGAIEIAVYGKVSQKANFIATTAKQLTPDWVQVTPAQPLEPGEYALVEMLGKDVNLYVWDFGVNPAAPQNDKAWRPAPADPREQSKEDPVLNKRPKD